MKISFILFCLIANLTLSGLKGQDQAAAAVPLPELEWSRAAKVMSLDSLLYKELYGKGKDRVTETDFFDVFSNDSVANPIKAEVVDNELVITATTAGSMIPFAPKIIFPCTIDIKLRAEIGTGGSVNFPIIAQNKYSNPQIGPNGLADASGSISFDPKSPHTLRFVFDKGGNGRIYVLDEKVSLPLESNNHPARQGLEIRIYNATLYIQEVDLYEGMP